MNLAFWQMNNRAAKQRLQPRYSELSSLPEGSRAAVHWSPEVGYWHFQLLKWGLRRGGVSRQDEGRPFDRPRIPRLPDSIAGGGDGGERLWP